MPLFSLICRTSDRIMLAESLIYDSKHKDFITKGRKLFDAMTPSTETAGVISTPDHYYLYLLDKETTVCFMTFCDKSYPRKLAYKYLEELKQEFLTRHSNDLKQKKLRPYAFEKFDAFIQATAKMYKDTQSEYNLNKVASDLKDVSKLVQNNLADIIDRGGKIERMSSLSEELVADSKRWEDKTKQLVWQQWVRSWGLFGIVFLFAIFVILFLYYFR